MDCFGTYLTHVQSCDNVRVHSATQWTASVHTHAQSCDNVHVQSATGRTASVHTHAQSCDNVHVQSATDWAGSVHTLHMPKAVIKFVFEVYGMDCWRTYLHMPKSVITFVSKYYTEWIVFSPFSRFRRFHVFAFSFFPVSVLGVFAFSHFRVFVFRRRHPRGRDTDFVCTGILRAGHFDPTANITSFRWIVCQRFRMEIFWSYIIFAKKDPIVQRPVKFGTHVFSPN